MDNELKKEGFVLLWRKIIKTSWYKKGHCFKLATYCVMKANHEDTMITWNNAPYMIRRGEFVTGLFTLHKETGIPIQQIRTCIKILVNSGFLTIKSTNKFSHIFIGKYEQYQIKSTRTSTNN